MVQDFNGLAVQNGNDFRLHVSLESLLGEDGDNLMAS